MHHFDLIRVNPCLTLLLPFHFLSPPTSMQSFSLGGLLLIYFFSSCAWVPCSTHAANSIAAYPYLHLEGRQRGVGGTRDRDRGRPRR